jgi:hypothetical protein
MKRIVGSALFWLVCAGVAAAAQAEIPKPEHPDPGAVRERWANLNGTWQFQFDPSDKGLADGWFKPGAPGFDLAITVPFGWESALSGIHRKDYRGVAWYRRTFSVPADFPQRHRVWLRFGAVDWRAHVWINGRKMAEHEGGYAPFEADITSALEPGGENVVTVRAFDPTDANLPTGKQVQWYTPTSGIWQTVWLESRPAAHIRGFTIRTQIDPARVHIELELAGLGEGQYTVSAQGALPAITPASTTCQGPVKRPDDTPRGALVPHASLDLDVRQPKLWTPENPNLYDLVLELKGPAGQVDALTTYFGLRTIGRGRFGDAPFERVLLNGRPIYLLGALDQSFNPEGIYTAPSDAFLKRDIELARSFGLNYLRVHIKPDEPRRLYWADKLGMMIMEDMPNTWEQNPGARQAWELTMREVVARDRNHPAIFSWVAFNETWGLGRPPAYKADKDTQKWVGDMVAAIRQLDPTRLVEDNSPCNYDHVENTDLNSWHFYIDDADEARRHIDSVVARTEPGSPFNYCPGLAQSTAPLINSEFGSVSAGGGDRDISWGFRDLVTQLRRYPKIQGYIYTELSDIEWEHNGFVNYDRTPKQFGYEAFVPEMRVADLQGPDFIGYNGPPAIVARPGETVRVPLFVSHYSDRTQAPRLRWWVSGYDGEGSEVNIPARVRDVEWKQYGVTELKPVGFQITPGPFVGALGMALEDASGKRIAANFVNVVIQPERPQPRVQWRAPRSVALRFEPADFARQHWSGGVGTPEGKAYGRGAGFFEYRLKLPRLVGMALPVAFELLLEVSAKAGRERVDWPERVNAQDNPQTDTRRWPSTLEVSINGQPVARQELADDPADARGVLSHLARFEHGSYGELIRLRAELPEGVRADLAAGKPLVLRIAVPDDAEHKGGLCLFGAHTGRYPFDPTLTLDTTKILPEDLEVKPDQPITVDTALSRQKVLLAAGDSVQGGDSKTTWSYTTSEPASSWTDPSFDDHAWSRGAPGFGTSGTPALRMRTHWETPRIWLRTTLELPKIGASDSVALHLFHDEDVEIFVNGKPLYRGRGYLTSYRDIPLSDDQKALFHPGPNVIAATCRQTGGGQGIDIGLKWVQGE